METTRIYEALITAHRLFVLQQKRKLEHCTEALAIANNKLGVRHEEKQNRESELAVAKACLLFENSEKEKRALELDAANSELNTAREAQKQNILALEEMMFMISHKVRQPVANILGIACLLEENEIRTPAEFKELVQSVIGSAIALNQFTIELSTLIHTERGTPVNICSGSGNA
jgi:signal transduction histidine kinase